ncbi:MAG: hypothetical protein IIC93_07220 [Chloroflexi bacterium]|nr:hypothetical protein [Chloroflexota bacterium]
MASLLKHLLRFLLLSTVPDAARSESQRGLAVFSLAVVGLLFTGMMAGPLLGRTALGLLAQTDESLASVTGTGAASGAEYALWLIANDPDFLDSMTGSPPSATFELVLPTGTTTITVMASSDPPPDDGITATFGVSPNIVSPNATSTLTYTMTVTNDDTVPHQINRVETKTWFWSPAYIPGSTTGFTSVDPSQGGFWRWDFSPSVEVPPFGGEVTMQYQVTGNEDWGTYWTTGSARIVGIGTIDAPTTARVRFMDLDTLTIDTSVTPTEVSAGLVETFTYAIDVTNSGPDLLTMRWIRHYADDQFTYTPGSSSGTTLSDPAVWWNPTTQRYTYEWSLGGLILPGNSTTQLTFEMTAGLVPGIHTTRSSIKVEEDEGWVHKFFDLSSFETGETAPITARRSYTINVTQGNAFVDVEAWLTASGADVLSWLEGVSP